jgi:hypothetical protein
MNSTVQVQQLSLVASGLQIIVTVLSVFLH